MMWQTTWSGTSLEALGDGRDQFCSLPIAELHRQAECIDSTLQHARVMHLDQLPKNLAIWKGSIALFDFDVAVLDNDPKNELLSQLFDIAVGNSNYTVWKIRNIRWKLCQSTPQKESRHRFIPSLLSSETSNVKKGSVGAKKRAHKNGAAGDGSNRPSKQENTKRNRSARNPQKGRSSRKQRKMKAKEDDFLRARSLLSDEKELEKKGRSKRRGLAR
mmetsp:Transcript_44650/g.90205  ORF Transcript_44650/g.90205 Transcript_44650/m.90205 type:complete len:217 (+) Transcript_44650:3-653(+)